MRFSRLILVGLALVFMLGAHEAYARAKLMLTPTRIVMDGKTRSVEVSVINQGDRIGQYRIDTLEMQMPEEGNVAAVPEGTAVPYAATPMLRISPRSMTLQPGETQKLRIMLRKPPNLADGEYRSHLRVTVTSDGTEQPQDAEGDEAAKKEDKEAVDAKPTHGFGVKITPRYNLIVPIIVRQGKTEFTATIESAAVRKKDNFNLLDLVMTKEGNRSSMGDLKITYFAPNGKEYVVGFFQGVTLYRETAKKKRSYGLDLPEDVTLSGGKLKIIYTRLASEGGGVIAEKELPL